MCRKARWNDERKTEIKKCKCELEVYHKFLDYQSRQKNVTRNLCKIETVRVVRQLDKRCQVPMEIIKTDIACEIGKCLIENKLVRLKISESDIYCDKITAEIRVVKEEENADG